VSSFKFIRVQVRLRQNFQVRPRQNFRVLRARSPDLCVTNFLFIYILFLLNAVLGIHSKNVETKR